ncbi:MAG: transposase [Planctomycetales bacterium]|nr:transposase [Planctomycetales bacterium]
MDDRLKQFRVWDVMEGRREIFCPEDSLPEDDLVFFLLDLIPQLDLTAIYGFYSTDLRGQPPFDGEMMTTLLVYSYSVEVFSSHKIALACERNLAFLAIVGNDRPDFRTLSDFRKHHQAAMKPLFLEVLRVAGELGLVKLGNLSTDGTKIEAHASRHKAMSYGYLTKDLERLQAEINKPLESADSVDAEQDGALGSRRGDELPDELKRRQERIEKIQEAKARLETEARARAEAEQRERDAATAQREAKGKSRKGKLPAPIDPTPAAKAQPNFTDPEAKIMKRSNKGSTIASTRRPWWTARTRSSWPPLPTTSSKPCRWRRRPWKTWRRRASSGHAMGRANPSRSPTPPTPDTSAKSTSAT